MIKRVSDMVIDFSLTIHPPMNQWGDCPDLDQVGATLHLSRTYTINELDVYTWIQENNLTFITAVDYNSRIMRLTFTNLEDAMAFKLRWL